MRIGFLRGSQKKLEYWEDQEMEGSMIFKYIFKKHNAAEWTVLIWLRIGSGLKTLLNTVMTFRVR